MSPIITGSKTSPGLALLPMTLTSRLTRTITGLALALLPACACTHPPSAGTQGRTTMSDQTRDKNRQNVVTLFESFNAGGDLSHLDDLIAPDYVGPQGDKGP